MWGKTKLLRAASSIEEFRQATAAKGLAEERGPGPLDGCNSREASGKVSGEIKNQEAKREDRIAQWDLLLRLLPVPAGQDARWRDHGCECASVAIQSRSLSHASSLAMVMDENPIQVFVRGNHISEWQPVIIHAGKRDPSRNNQENRGQRCVAKGNANRVQTKLAGGSAEGPEPPGLSHPSPQG